MMSESDVCITLDWIEAQVRRGDYEFSEHAERERQADRIPVSDVERALLGAEILEDYPDDPRGPSCLVLGYGVAGYPIHVVCGRSRGGTLRIITPLQVEFLPIVQEFLSQGREGRQVL